MTHKSIRNGPTSGVISWSANSTQLPVIADEDGADVDEPPDSHKPFTTNSNFHRNPIHRSVDFQHHSLLTKALHSPSEDESAEARAPQNPLNLRRTTASNISLASTADLTSDTGLTSPSRTNTPSPPLPELGFLNLDRRTASDNKQTPQEPLQKSAAPKKRCIQFACAQKPSNQTVEKPAQVASQRPGPAPKVPSETEPRRKTCIKFAYCPASRPASTPNTPPKRQEVAPSRLQPPPSDHEASPVAIRKSRKSSSHSRSPRTGLQRRSSRDTPRKAAPAKKYITVTDQDMHHDAARFHEFASDDHCDEDWIRESVPSQGRKLTINDTLAKENEIRRLAAEAEAEAEEEDEEETATEDDEKDNDAGADVDDDDDEDDLSGYDTEDEEDDDDEDDSDGYHTDEETGFADSDDENDDLQLWIPAQPAARLSGGTPVSRRASFADQVSDSSIESISSVKAVRSGKVRRMKIRPGTPELPDSTDFVCGTLDEDRPLEDAYISCLEARRREKFHVIPQDIDPSFPASEPENEEAEDQYNPVKHASDDEDVWFHGEMEDIHHDEERKSRKKKSDGHRHSPKRYHSPPPKRYHSPPPKRLHSPPPKGRGRSPPPKGLFDRRSPRRVRSPPPPQMIKSPPASFRAGQGPVNIAKELASRPGLTVTKSLPRPPALFPNNMRHSRRHRAAAAAHADNDVHVRSAIDIVKGLERKRQRRKEKYYQKYCNRARKGQIPERKPMPGMGCERMRELGLLMAGKIDQGNYVLSV